MENNTQEQKTVTLKIDKSWKHEKSIMTFRDLYEQVLEEIDTYRKHGMEEELMNQEVVLSLCDTEGQLVNGYSCMLVGYLEGGGVLITGNVEEVYANKK
jgi:hypothetical protein